MDKKKFPEIIHGYEGHTKQKLLNLEDTINFIHSCLSLSNSDYDLDDLAYFIEIASPFLKNSQKKRTLKSESKRENV